MTNHEKLAQVVQGFSEEMVAEIIDFAEYLELKAERALDRETKNWLDADLSRLSEIEPYDWAGTDPLAGEPIYWDETEQELKVRAHAD